MRLMDNQAGSSTFALRILEKSIEVIRVQAPSRSRRYTHKKTGPHFQMWGPRDCAGELPLPIPWHCRCWGVTREPPTTKRKLTRWSPAEALPRRDGSLRHHVSGSPAGRGWRHVTAVSRAARARTPRGLPGGRHRNGLVSRRGGVTAGRRSVRGQRSAQDRRRAPW